MLALVLAEHPAQLTIPEIAREVGGTDVPQTVGDLARAGLLRQEGESILPTRAALCFDQLAA